MKISTRPYLPIALFFAFFIPQWAYPQTRDLDGIVAVVGDRVITESQLSRELKALSPQEGSSIHRTQALDHLIDEALLLNQAQVFGLQVSEAELHQVIQDIARKNKLSLTALKKALLQSGISFQDYQDSIRKQMLLSQVQTALVSGKIEVSDSEVQEAWTHSPSLSRAEVQNQLIQEKIKNQVPLLLKELREKAYVKVFKTP